MNSVLFWSFLFLAKIAYWKYYTFSNNDKTKLADSLQKWISSLIIFDYLNEITMHSMFNKEIRERKVVKSISKHRMNKMQETQQFLSNWVVWQIKAVKSYFKGITFRGDFGDFLVTRISNFPGILFYFIFLWLAVKHPVPQNT